MTADDFAPCRRKGGAAMARAHPAFAATLALHHMPADVKAQYEGLVAAGDIERDRAQEKVLDLLARLELRLREHRLARKSSSLGWMFGARERAQEPIRGLYIHGDVGRGKTLLMDLFFAASAVMRKRRAHFHEFMSDVHE